MVSLDFSEKPRVPRPALLLHPSIPPALAGVNPRTIRGQAWWDIVRKKTYAKYDYHCVACDVHQLDTTSQKLDAHECYNYNYKRRRAYFVEIVALCRDCHMFVHWVRIGRLRERRRILVRGLRILHEAGLGLPYHQVRAVNKFFWTDPPDFLDTAMIGSVPPYSDFLSLEWKLVFEGKLYPRRG